MSAFWEYLISISPVCLLLIKAVGELGCPAADLRRIECGVGGIGKADPLQYGAAINLAGILAVELEGHVDA